MPFPVFLSYARSTSRAAAEALHHQLGGRTGLAFLDTDEIAVGAEFPATIQTALESAQIIVIFLDQAYLQSWYCLREFRVALGPIVQSLASGVESEVLEGEELDRFVIALPAAIGDHSRLLDHLPPQLRFVNWPRANDTKSLTALIHGRLKQRVSAGRRASPARPTEEYRALEWVIPPSMGLQGVPHFPPYLVRSIGEAFVGRGGHLWLLHFLLTTVRGAPLSQVAPVVTLSGGGGFGKTRLALEYLHRFGPRYHSGGLFWLDASEGKLALNEQFRGILGVLRPDLPVQRYTADEVASHLARTLGQIKQPALFIVDDVPEVATDQSLVKWWSTFRDIPTLVLSRRLVPLALAVDQEVKLSTLSREAAVALLTRGITFPLRPPDGWRSIARWVGDLPLALELLNSALRDGGASAERLLAEVRRGGPAMELEQQWTLLRPHLPEGSLRGVLEAFATSFRTLSPTARLAAHRFAFLSPAPIPGKLVDALIGEPERRELRVRSFIGPAPQGEEVEIYGRMHRVLADYLASCQSESGRSATLWPSGRVDTESPSRYQSLTAVLKAFEYILRDDWLKDPGCWPLIRVCVPHLEWFWSSALRSLYRTPEWERVIRLGQRFATWLEGQGIAAGRHLGEGSPAMLLEAELEEDHPRSLLRSFEAVAGLDLLLKPDAPDHVEELSFEMLSVAERTSRKERKGIRQDLPMLEKVFKFRQKHLPLNHAATLKAQYDLASALYHVEEWGQARQQFQSLLEICLRLFGPLHWNTRSCFYNLSFTYMKAGEGPGDKDNAAWQRLLDKYKDILAAW